MIEKVINGAIFLVDKEDQEAMDFANFICQNAPAPGDFVGVSKDQIAAAKRIHRMELTFKHTVDIPKIHTGGKMAGLPK